MTKYLLCDSASLNFTQKIVQKLHTDFSEIMEFPRSRSFTESTRPHTILKSQHHLPAVLTNQVESSRKSTQEKRNGK